MKKKYLNLLNKKIIKLRAYAKGMKVPAFNHYAEAISQLQILLHHYAEKKPDWNIVEKAEKTISKNKPLLLDTNDRVSAKVYCMICEAEAFSKVVRSTFK